MILDALLQLADAQQVTADAVSENTIDLGNVTPKWKVGVGEPLVLVVAITAIGTNTGSAIIQAIMSAAAALTSPIVIGSINLATADIAAGQVYIVGLGQGPAALRYLGANFDITGVVDFTVDAFITPHSMASIIAERYAKNYVV